MADVPVADSRDSVIVAWDETASVPLSRSDFGFKDYGGGHIGLVSLTTKTDGGMLSSGNAFVEAQSDFFGLQSGTPVYALATATLTFHPLTPWVTVREGFPASGGGIGYGRFDDLTTGLALLTVGPYSTATDVVLALDPTHLYAMTASVGPNGGPGHNARWTISAATVPDGGSTLLYCAIGFGAVLLVARSPAFRSSN